MPRFVYTKFAQKQFEQLDAVVQERVRKKLNWLKSHEHFESLLTRLQDVDETTYKLRVGNYRILLDRCEEKDQYVILDVDHRSRIYQ